MNTGFKNLLIRLSVILAGYLAITALITHSNLAVVDWLTSTIQSVLNW